MSATRDPSQPVTFIYSNLHEIYRNGLDAARAADVSEASSVISHQASASEAQSVRRAPEKAAVLTTAEVAKREHPRFGERSVDSASSSQGWMARSETYRVLKPSQVRLGDKVTPHARASLRSSSRVLKAGERLLAVDALKKFQPIHFLRRAVDRSEALKPTIRPGSSPEIKLELKLALMKQEAESAGSTKNLSQAVKPNASEFSKTSQRLDRLQSRLHFLLREIQEFTGSGSGESDSGERT
jgi:hypothetical protein